MIRQGKNIIVGSSLGCDSLVKGSHKGLNYVWVTNVLATWVEVMDRVNDTANLASSCEDDSLFHNYHHPDDQKWQQMA